jgi:hypothetical protein
MRSNAISAGDVVRAFRILAARDEETRTAMARILGFDLPPEARTGASERQMRKDETPSQHSPEVSLYEPPLFNPQWTRAMISTMARIRTRSGPPEIETLVTAAAGRQPMLSLALTVSETASGADVLLDAGEHMAIFSREQARLVQMMRRVLGRGMVSSYRFFGSPVRGVEAAASGLAAYRPARPGWPVIALTDLGIGGGTAAAQLSEWLEFSRVVRSGGCHLLALVPYPPASWPAELASSMHIIEWGRASNVRTIKTALRSIDRHCR